MPAEFRRQRLRCRQLSDTRRQFAPPRRRAGIFADAEPGAGAVLRVRKEDARRIYIPLLQTVLYISLIEEILIYAACFTPSLNKEQKKDAVRRRPK